MTKKKQQTAERTRERFDKELALTNDILTAAQLLACHTGWRAAIRALFLVAMRIAPSYGRKSLADFLTDSNVGW